jgi:hypothetical protein
MLDAEPRLMGRRERLVAGNAALLESCSICGAGCARGFAASGERAWDFGNHRVGQSNSAVSDLGSELSGVDVRGWLCVKRIASHPECCRRRRRMIQRIERVSIRRGSESCVELRSVQEIGNEEQSS